MKPAGTTSGRQPAGGQIGAWRRLSVPGGRGLVLALFVTGALRCAARAGPSDIDPARLPSSKVEVVDPREAEDSLKLARAEQLVGDAKLDLLDEVSRSAGPRAAQAGLMARKERLLVIQASIDARDPVTAIAQIDRWFPDWKRDAYVTSQRALATDVTYAACSDDVCRYSSATQADAAFSTPERAGRVSAARAGLMSALAASETKGEPVLARLVRLRAVLVLASRPELESSNDTELSAQARTAQSWARAERDKVGFLNADEEIAKELLESVADRDAKVATATLDGTDMYLSLDSRKKVRGLYLVGTAPGPRAMGTTDAAERILARAMGHGVKIKIPTGAATTSRWSDGATPIVARWHDGQLTEVQVGDAKP